MKTMLVAISLGCETPRLVEIVGRLAQETNAQVWLFHVAEPNPDFVGFEAGPDSVRRSMAHVFRQQHDQLQNYEAILKQQGVAASALLIQGATVQKILAEAERLRVDFIVVGSRGHGALHDLLMGSTAEGVLRAATRPVLVVPARMLVVND